MGLVAVLFLVMTGFSSIIQAADIVELTAWQVSDPPAGMVTSKASDTKIGKTIANATGVSFTLSYSQGDREQNFNLRLASGDWEDVISTDLNFVWTDKLIKAKAIIQLDKYFTDPVKYPNLAKIPKKVLDNYRFTDGHIYQFPSQWYEDPKSAYGYWAVNGWYAEPGILKAVKMKASDLATIEGVEKYLRAVKKANLKDKNGNPIIPMTSGANLNFWKTIVSTFGVSTAGMGFQQLANGSLQNFRDNANTIKALKWLNKLQREGLLDKELISQKDEQLASKLTNKRVALLADEAWPFWGTVTAGKGPVTDLLYLNYPKVAGVSKLGISVTYNPLGTQGVFVSKKNKNPDAVARYADWSSAKGEFRGWEAVFGPYGELWDWDKDAGEPFLDITDAELKKAYETGDYKTMSKLGSASIINITPFDLDLNYFRKASEAQLFWILGMHRFNVKQGYTAPARSYDNLKMPANGLWNKNLSILNKLDLEYFTKLILAKTTSAFDKTWLEYRTQLEKQGNWTKTKAEVNTVYLQQLFKD